MSKVPSCQFHMPGNGECPLPAVYMVSSTFGRMTLRRPVCMFHMVAAIDGALDQTRMRDGVNVTMLTWLDSDERG